MVARSHPSQLNRANCSTHLLFSGRRNRKPILILANVLLLANNCWIRHSDLLASKLVPQHQSLIHPEARTHMFILELLLIVPSPLRPHLQHGRLRAYRLSVVLCRGVQSTLGLQLSCQAEVREPRVGSQSQRRLKRASCLIPK